MMYLEQVNKHRGLYCSDLNLENRHWQKERQIEMMSSLMLTNELGESVSLLDAYMANVSNPVNRRHELMTRISGFEALAKSHNHQGIFVTVTCPSRFHAAYASTGQRNLKWDGSTPAQSQTYLNAVWSRTRAEAARRSIHPYGLRVAEPQHDGTPHWHMVLFLPKEQVNEFSEIIRHYALEDSGDEPGAQENRVDVKYADPEKGTAAGYMAKYISKNIDGEYIDDDTGESSARSKARRVEAWASCWGIRQFQQIGGAAVTVWRELRRIKAKFDENSLLARIHKAADEGDWAAYVELMGGVYCPRKDQAIRPHYDITFDMNTGEVRSSWFDDIPLLKLKGVMHLGEVIVTRIHQWRVERQKDNARRAISFHLEFCK